MLHSPMAFALSASISNSTSNSTEPAHTHVTATSPDRIGKHGQQVQRMREAEQSKQRWQAKEDLVGKTRRNAPARWTDGWRFKQARPDLQESEVLESPPTHDN